MSIGFAFTAKVKTIKSEVLEVLAQTARECGYEAYTDKDSASVHFCRMGDLYISFKNTKKGLDSYKKELSGDCQTNLAGAGFHAAAIDFVDRFAQAAGLKLRMEDETDYYDHRDFERMRREHFYSWLRQIVHICKEQTQGEAYSGLCVCWDMDQYTPKEVEDSVVTPFGRFSVTGLVARVEAGGIEPFAREFFLWNEREQDARMKRNTALSLLWEDCYFMPSSRSGEDAGINREIISLLEEAASMDKTLPFPKEEYLLLCGLDGREPLDVSGLPDYEPEYPIGFRRDVVSHKLGNFTIPLPGSFLYEYEEDSQSHLWWGGPQEDWRSLRVSALRRRTGDAEFSENLFSGAADGPVEFDAGDGKGRAAFAGTINEDGEDFYQSIGEVICGPSILLITASYHRPEGRDWAMETICGIRGKKEKTGR